MKKNKNFTVILASALVLVSVMITVVVVGLTLPVHPEIIQGQAETTDYRLSSKVPARVLEIRVREGDNVRKGDTLVVMEAPDIAAKLMQAEAAYAAAEAQQRKSRNGSRQEELQQAYEMWQKACAGKEVAEKTYNRVNRLFENGVMAEQKRDEALAQLEAMAATEKAAKAQYEMARNGARHEDRSMADAQLDRARGAMTEVASYVAETVLTASADGVVTEIFPEVGELVGTGAPIMNVACTDDLWFTFNIREDLLPGLTVGTETTVYMPALDKRVDVRITKMKDVGSFAAWKATKALDKFDLRTFEVEARPTNAASTAGAREGMTAVMEIRRPK
ncbi:MAG: HlyD family secretion protein [Bacteroidaceae bacterium]